MKLDTLVTHSTFLGFRLCVAFVSTLRIGLRAQGCLSQAIQMEHLTAPSSVNSWLLVAVEEQRVAIVLLYWYSITWRKLYYSTVLEQEYQYNSWRGSCELLSIIKKVNVPPETFSGQGFGNQDAQRSAMQSSLQHNSHDSRSIQSLHRCRQSPLKILMGLS